MGRLTALLCALAAAFLVVAGPAQAQSRYASVVIDADTGQVLHDRFADAPRYPASITKVMTLYLLFEAIEQGRVRRDEWLPVSARAAGMPPSKLGLSAGGAIRVDDAIRALVVRSANDASVVIAERLAGSEEAFADLMTARAQQLGMRSTRFANASGLPDNRQMTTARDLARLAIAIRRDFPQEWAYFQTPHMVWAGQLIGNHNRLLGRVPGVDGLKTGYTRASGFNLATTAERNGRRIVAVVMGGSSGAARDAHMADLVEAAFQSLGTGAPRQMWAGRWPQVADAEAASANTARTQRYEGADTVDTMLLGADPDPLDRLFAEVARAAPVALADAGPTARAAPAPVRSGPAAALGGVPAAASRAEPAIRAPAAPTSSAPAARPSGPAMQLAGGLESAVAATGARAAPRGRITEGEARPRIASRQPSSRPVTPQRRPGDWGVQVGAFQRREQAEAKLSTLSRNLPSALLGARAQVVPVARNDGTWFRARFVGVAPGAAIEACREISRRGDNCMAVDPAA